MDRLVNINEVSDVIRRTDSQITYVESRIKRLEISKTALMNKKERLTSMKRDLGIEQYKEFQVRQELITKGKKSKNTKANWLAINLEKAATKWDDGLETETIDRVIDDFVTLENIVSRRRNYSIASFFEIIGKTGLEGKEDLIENIN